MCKYENLRWIEKKKEREREVKLSQLEKILKVLY